MKQFCSASHPEDVAQLCIKQILELSFAQGGFVSLLSRVFVKGCNQA